MSYQPETPFDNIEGSHEYVAMLLTPLKKPAAMWRAEISAADRDGADRRKQALLLVSFQSCQVESPYHD